MVRLDILELDLSEYFLTLGLDLSEYRELLSGIIASIFKGVPLYIGISGDFRGLLLFI
jgi:hypothetical protein